MINVQENFKIDLRTYGRQFNIKLKVNNSDFNADNLNYIKPSFTTPLFKTIMHQIELDSKVFMPKDTKISGRIGVKVNEKNYKYIDLNNYYVQSCERQEDTNSYRVLAYSKMKEAMLDYDLSFEGKTTVRNYLIKICERLGWNTDNIPATFINSEKLVNPSLHTGIKYSFRDALDEIATITCSFLMFKGDNFYLLYLTETNETIDESYLDEDNVTIGEKYFINSLVFSRAEESDNIYRKDNTSITANGLHEYRIADCQLLSTNDRADYIDEMFNYLKTLEFYIFDVQSKGILFLEACDLFNFKLNNITYKVALLNDEINIDDGLKENLFLDKPEETETEYKYADSTDKKINQAYILVDKQNKKIIQKVSSVEQSVENITNTQNTATGKNIHLEDSSDEPLVSIKVKGETNQVTRSGKNLLDNTATTKISNGITFTVNSDGTVLVDGTNDTSANSSLIINRYDLSPGTYILNGCPSGGAINTYRLVIQETGSYSILGSIDIGNGSGEFTIDTTTNVQIAIFIQKGLTINKLLFKPMLRKATIADDTYEQYGASPSPDYLSPIENVEGKNKFNNNFSDYSKPVDYYICPIHVKNETSYKFNINLIRTKMTGCVIGIVKDGNQYSNFVGLSQALNTAGIVNNLSFKVDNTWVSPKLIIFAPNGETQFKQIFENYEVQLEEGTVATDYVPYNSLEIKDIGENLLNATAKTTTAQGITFKVNADKSITINGTNTGTGTYFFRIANNFVLPAGDYTLSNKNANASARGFLFYDDENNFPRKNISNATFTKDTTIKPYIRIDAGTTINNQTIYPMIIKGTYTEETIPEYKPYQEQKVTFPLGNQKLMEDSYLASDGIYYKRKQVVFDGSDDEGWTSYSTKNGLAYRIPILNIKQIISTTIIADLYCDYYTRTSQDKIYDEKIDYGICQRANQSQIIIRNKDILTLAEWKAWLSNNPVTVEYELSEEKIVPYTEAQQEAWDKIEQLHTYKNVTNIFSDTELDIVYVRDNGLSDMYETKQNASKNYTKTSTEIQQLDDSIKRTISQIGDRSQKTTTITEDIDGINSKVKNFQDLTQTTSGTKTIVLSNCAKGDLLSLRIKGNNTVFEYLYPSSNLYPANNLLPMGDSRISVNETVYELGITDVLRKNGEVYDEFVLENGQAKIIRRINTDGTVKAKETTEDLGKLSISLNEGTNTIKIINYTAEITAKYAIKSDYTDIFATKVEMSSSIEQTAEGINQVVRKKVDENEIISKINQTAEDLTIDANRININGTVSANGNFKVDTNGNMECVNAKINVQGGENTGDSSGLNLKVTNPNDNYNYSGLAPDFFIVRNGKGNYVNSEINKFGTSLQLMDSWENYITMRAKSGSAGTSWHTSDSSTSVSSTGITTPTLTQTSKAESKKNFEKFTLEEAKEILNNTDIYKYNLKSQGDKDKKHIGFVIGKDYNYSEKITSEKNDGANIYSMTSVLYTIVQEQQKQIEELQQRVEKLEGGQDK